MAGNEKFITRRNLRSDKHFLYVSLPRNEEGFTLSDITAKKFWTESYRKGEVVSADGGLLEDVLVAVKDDVLIVATPIRLEPDSCVVKQEDGNLFIVDLGSTHTDEDYAILVEQETFVYLRYVNNL